MHESAHEAQPPICRTAGGARSWSFDSAFRFMLRLMGGDFDFDAARAATHEVASNNMARSDAAQKAA